MNPLDIALIGAIVFVLILTTLFVVMIIRLFSDRLRWTDLVIWGLILFMTYLLAMMIPAGYILYRLKWITD